ncbi:hypothetical protein LTR70_006647 [Exophiala xenobiotica]|uniref:Uncharacterized protein n=1 Tax=Lithohypha guttulata TaxID=1690604 RepID=A0ABR0KNK4_9EURO|nr:hypothetical protein LTR24_000355 [Lithohypha guttulata]KAK5315656.1 hypothetical protein LTR70_006647 [Exophiala xenobiotica]
MPPKGQRTAVPEDAFLFVREDFSTLFGDSRNARLGRSKQSHVQRRSFAKRREGKKTGEESASQSPASSDSGGSPTSSGGRQSSLRPSSDAHSTNLSLTESLRLPPQEPSIAQAQSSTLAARIKRQRWLPTGTASPSQHPLEISAPHRIQTEESSVETGSMVRGLGSAGVNDPIFESGLLQSRTLPPSPSLVPSFNSRVPLETWAPSLMKYFTLTMIPEFFHTDLKAVSLNDMRHVEDLHADMRSCMSNPAEMYALLAASASHSMGKSGRLDLPAMSAEHNERVILVLISKSFEALQHRLASGGVTHRVVIAIQRMACAALYASNFSTAEPHYRAAMPMIEQLGGLETFNDYEKERLIMHNLYYALRAKCAPEVKLTWDPGPFTSDARSEVVSSISRETISTSSGMGTIAETLQADLHPIVAQAILDLAEVQEVLGWLRTQAYRPTEYRWLMQRRLAIMHSLLSLRSDAGTLSGELIRIALICFIVLSRILQWSEHLLPRHYVAPALSKWTAESLDETFAAYPETLLWIMVLYGILLTSNAAANGWMDNTGLTDVAALVSDVGRRSCRSLDIATESELRVALQKTLLDDEVLNERYLSFCEIGLGLKLD